MSYRPEVHYDAEKKIWTGAPEPQYYRSDLSIGEVIFYEMRRHPKEVAQISTTENTVLTREELLQNAMRIASYMRQLKLRQTDVVGIIARNTTHISAVAYACFFNGIAFHSLNVMYEQKTIESLYEITQPKLIFCDGDEYDKVRAATSSLDIQLITMRNHKPDALSILNILSTPIEKGFVPARLELGNNQTLAILCTSGTTGTPKAVPIINSRKLFGYPEPLTISDVQYCHSSLDWATGLLTLITTGVYSTKRIIADSAFDPVTLLRIIEDYKVTWLLQSPSHMAMVANCTEFQNANLDSLNYYILTGGRSSVEVQKLFYERLRNCNLDFMYGFSEVGTIATMNCHFEEKTNSVGRVVNGMKLKILNEQGQVLGIDEIGEICILNGQYWAGYYGNIKESNKIRDQEFWFHTGDLGYVDKDGFLYIIERKKDLLKYQGIMYYPNEIEEIISQMPAVSEVCVFGVWDDVYGDKAAASVVKKLGSELSAEDVIDYVANHIESSYKHLKGGVLIVDNLQLSPNGKSNRQATKSHFLKTKDSD